MYNPCIQISIILSLVVQYQFGAALEIDADNTIAYRDQWGRQARTLLNQFPFNQGAHHQGSHHGAHHGQGNHHGHHQTGHLDHGNHGQHGFQNGFPQLHQGFGNAQRLSRQGAANGANEIDDIGPLDIGTIAQAGERCVEKVMMIEETKYDDSIECHHSYDERCHTTYTTDYEPQQVEDCDENFVKECHIEYENKAFDEQVEICNERPIRDCQGKEGPVTCETVYETECQTSYHLHEVEEDQPKCETQMMEKCRDVTQGYTTQQECDKWPQQICQLEKKVVKKYSPETECKKLPRQLCGPGACPIIAGPKECRKEMKTIVQEVPKERCSLRAQPFCEFETKLVPVLKPVDNCVDVPKEVCVRMRTNPRKVKRPVIKKWCYVPTAESGLSNEDDYDQNENVDTDSTNSETSDNTEGSGAVVEEVPSDNPGSDSDEVDTDEAPVEEEEESSSSDASTDDDNKDDSSSTAAKRRRRKNKNPNRRIGVPFSG
jgi:hypothetical protein